MSAIRKLAAEAADNGLLAPELAAGIARVKSAKTQGIRTGNWLSLRQAQALLSAPDATTTKGLRTVPSSQFSWAAACADPKWQRLASLIVDGAGEEKIFHLPDRGQFRTERQNISERIMQDCNQNQDGDV
jgi:hypothetical protein